MKRFLIALVAAASPLMAADLTYEQAKILADQDEASLSRVLSASLVASQGRVAGVAFAGCPPTGTSSDKEPFTVVMRLDASGKVERTWLLGRSAIAVCINEALSTATLFTPPKVPFYTSFEMSWK